MKDIPFFSTDNGVASLTLKEIPIRQRAYIKILSSAVPEKLLEDCKSFCRACGAEEIFAGGEGVPVGSPPVATLVQLQADLADKTDACLFPVTEKTVSEWIRIYNDCMKDVPNASWKTKLDEKQILADRDCYFVHKNGEFLGIGKAKGDSVDALASVKRGAGKDVLLALASLLEGNCVKLVAAKENTAAMRLYDSLGFVQTSEVARWYKIF